MEALLGPRAAAVHRRLEVPVMLSALAVLPMFVFELVATDGWPARVAVVINWIVWSAFFLEFVLLFSLTDHRRAYLRRAWLHLSVIPLAFPLLTGTFSGSVGEDAFRALRFLVLVAVLIHSCVTLYRLLKHVLFRLLAVARHPWMYILGPLLRMRVLGLVLVLFGSLAVSAGSLYSVFEDHHPVEGMWWALVTLTTVGYGDITPVTIGGRVTAALLMLSGIGVLSFTTATVAAHFVEGNYKRELRQEIHSVNERLDAVGQRLDRIEELLASKDPD